jgi:quinoprotein glucose dehydrogenase
MAAGRLAIAAVAAALLSGCGAPVEIDYSGPLADWPVQGGDAGNTHASPLTQIDPGNVDALDVAWVYHHGDVRDGSDGGARTTFEATPIVVDDTLYFCTGLNRVIALDPETGAERWTFDPKLRIERLGGPYFYTCRGVSYWRDAAAPKDAVCSARIYTATTDSELIALDARTGAPCTDFGSAGRVNLRAGIGEAPDWEYYTTSPPLVLRDRVVVGSFVADNVRVDAPSGVVRAFDARSGRLLWAWDPVPPGVSRPETSGGPAYTPGTPNVWSILSGDAERGLVFVPTGNAAPDLYGGERKGLDYYSSSVVALRLEDGGVAWHFQTVHHDVWDYDVGTAPLLFQDAAVANGVPALAQATKVGNVFLLDRETGVPLYPVEERPVPQGGALGEALSPTQPFPTHPPPLHPQRVGSEDAFGFTFWDRGRCREKLESLRNDGIFTPPTEEGTLEYPGAAGGMNWGGIAFEPHAGILVANVTRAIAEVRLIPREIYETLPERKVARFPLEFYPMRGTPYGAYRGPVLSPLGAPCNPPPWGTLVGVDLASGEVLWESVLGTTRDMAPFPIWLRLGTPNFGGGSIVTASGLVFIAATTDKFLRAFDLADGEEIWSHRLPFTGNATPLTYRIRRDGRQFVVIAAGGHGFSASGDALVAFALPLP